MSPEKPAPKVRTVACPACNGLGTIANATEDVACAACGGTGRVKEASTDDAQK